MVFLTNLLKLTPIRQFVSTSDCNFMVPTKGSLQHSSNPPIGLASGDPKRPNHNWKSSETSRPAPLGFLGVCWYFKPCFARNLLSQCLRKRFHDFPFVDGSQIEGDLVNSSFCVHSISMAPWPLNPLRNLVVDLPELWVCVGSFCVPQYSTTTCADLDWQINPWRSSSMNFLRDKVLKDILGWIHILSPLYPINQWILCQKMRTTGWFFRIFLGIIQPQHFLYKIGPPPKKKCLFIPLILCWIPQQKSHPLRRKACWASQAATSAAAWRPSRRANTARSRVLRACSAGPWAICFKSWKMVGFENWRTPPKND